MNHHQKKALYINEMTAMLVKDFSGRVPETEAQLRRLKGATCFVWHCNSCDSPEFDLRSLTKLFFKSLSYP